MQLKFVDVTNDYVTLSERPCTFAASQILDQSAN